MNISLVVSITRMYVKVMEQKVKREAGRPASLDFLGDDRYLSIQVLQ